MFTFDDLNVAFLHETFPTYNDDISHQLLKQVGVTIIKINETKTYTYRNVSHYINIVRHESTRYCKCNDVSNCLPIQIQEIQVNLLLVVLMLMSMQNVKKNQLLY